MTDQPFTRILRQQFDEYYDGLRKALSGLTAQERRLQVTASANHIDFLVWHMARNEDGTISMCERTEELWRRDGWYRQWNLPEDADGCGYPPEELPSFPMIEPHDLARYFAEVRSRTDAFLSTVAEDMLDEPLSADHPAVSVGQVLSHLVVEQGQHLGQVAFIRGLQRGVEHSTSWNNPDTPTPGTHVDRSV